MQFVSSLLLEVALRPTAPAECGAMNRSGHDHQQRLNREISAWVYCWVLPKEKMLCLKGIVDWPGSCRGIEVAEVATQ